MSLIWEYHLLLLILLRAFKNAGIETSYFTKTFYQKRVLHTKSELKKTRKEIKTWRKRLKITEMKMLRYFHSISPNLPALPMIVL